MSVFLPATSFNHSHESKLRQYKSQIRKFNEHVYLLSIREITAETGNHGWVNILPAPDSSSFLSRNFYYRHPLLILPPPLLGKQFWPRKRRFFCGHEQLDLPSLCDFLSRFVGNWSASLLSFCILYILPSPIRKSFFTV